MSLSVEAVAYRDGDGTGDPSRHCEQLTLRARGRGDAQRLALLNRVLSNDTFRERFFEALDFIELEPVSDPVLAHG